MTRFKYSILLLLLCMLAKGALAKDLELTLTEAISKDLVNITSIANGDLYNANALNIKIENKGKKALNITIDPALIFISKDTSYQDLLVVGNVKLKIQPEASANAVLQTYCAKSYASIPTRNLIYTFSRQADSSTIKLLDYVKKHNLNAELAQKGVWVFTNHKNINTVYDPANDIASKNLTLFLATLTRQNIPGYYKYFALNAVDTTGTEPQPITTSKPLRIFAFFKWIQKEDANLSLIVIDEKGKTIQPLFEKQAFKKGGYELTAKFESAEVESGNYSIRLMDGNSVLKEIKVNVD